jgi:3-deoxy-manno-octulosonate cytidylyltransferase (CMP-KDO synthetase)
MLADAMIAEPEWDMATAAAPFARPEDAAPSSVVKVVFAAAGRALYFSRWPIPFVRDAPPPAGETTHWLHVGIYAYRRAFLAKFVRAAPSPLERLEKLEQLRALHLGGAIKVVCTAARGIGVDTPEDVKKVEAILRKEYRGKSVEGRGPI